MDLNDDVATEVLVHLPVKSLLRFKSVCKSWCCIIDSSAFRKSHLKNQSENKNDADDILFLQFSKKKKSTREMPSTWELSSTLSKQQDNYWKVGKDFPLPFHEFLNVNSWNDLIVCGPINGLICMYDHDPIKDDRLGWSTVSIAICNPCLGETKILPLSPVLLDSEKWAKRPFEYRTIGFGFDSVTKDYKVVQVIRSLNGRAYVEVYSGRKNTWRVVDTDYIFDDRRWSCQIKTWCKSSGATAYWRMSGANLDYVILSFDMYNEVFGTIGLPEFVKTRYSKVFAKDDDSLVMFSYLADCRRLEVWEMGKERVWSRARDVNVQQFGQVAHCPIALWNYGVVFWTHDSKTKDLLIFYDYSIEKEKERVELPTRLGYGRMYLQYKSTLHSLEMCLN